MDDPLKIADDLIAKATAKWKKATNRAHFELQCGPKEMFVKKRFSSNGKFPPDWIAHQLMGDEKLTFSSMYFEGNTLMLVFTSYSDWSYCRISLADAIKDLKGLREDMMLADIGSGLQKACHLVTNRVKYLQETQMREQLSINEAYGTW